MAQQPLLALQVKPIQTPTYGDIMQERDAYRKQQNAMAQEQLKQQQNAMLNQAYADAYDPQTGRVDTNKLYGRLAQGGIGAQIPSQMEAYGKGVEAVAKGDSERYKLGQSFLTSAHDIIYNAASPEDAIAASVQYAQQHPGHPELMQAVTRFAGRIKNMTPEEFAAAKPGILSENLTAQQRLEQETQTVDTGAGGYVLGRSKYSNDPYAIVPGSQYAKTMTPQQQYEAQRDINNPEVQYIEMEDGSLRAMPKRLGGGGGIPGQRGGGAPTAGQYGAAIENAAMQLAPGVRVSGRGRTPERNAEVGGVANSYHLSDNARDLQPARGQSLDQLAASLAPLKQQGFDVIIERGKNHVHVEPGPGMGRAGAAPAADGIKMGQVVPGSGGGNAKTTQQEQTASYNINRVLQAAAEIQRVTTNNPSANTPSALEATVGSLPLISQGVNFTRGADRQIVAAAQRDLLDGLLYLATGAAYNKEQLQGQMESYIPSYSDGPATVASKRARLAALVASAKTRAGRAWTPQMDASLNALISGGKAPARPAPATKSSLPDDVRKKYGL